MSVLAHRSSATTRDEYLPARVAALETRLNAYDRRGLVSSTSVGGSSTLAGDTTGPSASNVVTKASGNLPIQGPRPWIDVTHPHYGADPNGLIDSRPMIQQAIDDMKAIGGDVYAIGTYLIGDPGLVIDLSLVTDRAVYLEGGGFYGGVFDSSVWAAPTRFKWIGSNAGTVITVKGVPGAGVLTNMGGWGLNGFYVDGNGTAGKLVEINCGRFGEIGVIGGNRCRRGGVGLDYNTDASTANARNSHLIHAKHLIFSCPTPIRYRGKEDAGVGSPGAGLTNSCLITIDKATGVYGESAGSFTFAKTDITGWSGGTNDGKIAKTSHGLVNGMAAMLSVTPGVSGGSMPSGLASNKIYYVKVFDPNTFQLSTRCDLASVVIPASQGAGTPEPAFTLKFGLLLPFSPANVTTGANTITITNHGLMNGQTVSVVTDGTPPGGVALSFASGGLTSQLYYVKKIDAHTIQLGKDIAGTDILSLSSGGAGNHYLVYGNSIGVQHHSSDTNKTSYQYLSGPIGGAAFGVEFAPTTRCNLYGHLEPGIGGVVARDPNVDGNANTIWHYSRGNNCPPPVIEGQASLTFFEAGKGESQGLFVGGNATAPLYGLRTIMCLHPSSPEIGARVAAGNASGSARFWALGSDASAAGVGLRGLASPTRTTFGSSTNHVVVFDQFGTESFRITTSQHVHLAATKRFGIGVDPVSASALTFATSTLQTDGLQFGTADLLPIRWYRDAANSTRLLNADIILSNGKAIRGRSVADNASLSLIQLNSSDSVLIGAAGVTDIRPQANLVLSLGRNIITDTAIGLKIATAPNQRVGFFNVAPAPQQAGGAVTVDGTWTANNQIIMQKLWDVQRLFGFLS